MTPDYWKIRALVLEHQQARFRCVEAEQKVTQALQAVGLDPAKSYQADDTTETLTEMEPMQGVR